MEREIGMSKLSHKHVSRRGVLKGAAATGLGLGAASSVFLPTAFGRQASGNVVFWTTHSGLGFEAMQKIGEDYNALGTGHTV